MSENQGRPTGGEERSRGGGWLGRILLGLLLLLLLVFLVPLACQALAGGGGDQGAGGNGQEEATNSEDTAADDGGETTGAPGEDTGGGAPTEQTTQGQAAQEQTVPEEPAEEPQDGAVTARLASIESQTGDGTTVTVPEAEVSGSDGWLAVYEGDTGRPDRSQLLGFASLQEGRNTNVEVALDRPVNASQPLSTVVHAEDPADGTFTFPEGDPAFVTDEEPMATTFEYTVDGTSDGGALPDTGGPPIAPMLLAGGAALLMAGAVFLARRAVREESHG